jgi:hypothetical protein
MITGLLKRLATIRSCQSVARTAARTSTGEGIRARFAVDDKHALAGDGSHAGPDRRDDRGGRRLRAVRIRL